MTKMITMELQTQQSTREVTIPSIGLFYLKETNPPVGYVQLYNLSLEKIQAALTGKVYQGKNLWNYPEIKALTGANETGYIKYMNWEDLHDLGKGIGERLQVDGKPSVRPMLLHRKEVDILFPAERGADSYPRIKDPALAKSLFDNLYNLSCKLIDKNISASRRKIAEYCYNLILTQLHSSNIEAFLDNNSTFFRDIDEYLLGDQAAGDKLIKVLEESELNSEEVRIAGRPIRFNPLAVTAHAEIELLREAFNAVESNNSELFNSPRRIGAAVLSIVSAYSESKINAPGDNIDIDPVSLVKKEIIALARSGRAYVTNEKSGDITEITTNCATLAKKTREKGLFVVLGPAVVFGLIYIIGASLAIWGLSGLSFPSFAVTLEGNMIDVGLGLSYAYACISIILGLGSIAQGFKQNAKIQTLSSSTTDTLSKVGLFQVTPSSPGAAPSVTGDIEVTPNNI